MKSVQKINIYGSDDKSYIPESSISDKSDETVFTQRIQELPKVSIDNGKPTDLQQDYIFDKSKFDTTNNNRFSTVLNRVKAILFQQRFILGIFIFVITGIFLVSTILDLINNPDQNTTSEALSYLNIAENKYIGVSTEKELSDESKDKVPIYYKKDILIYETPYTGELVSYKKYKELVAKRPISVVIDNQELAVPNSGLSKSDTVYEIDTEAGITRMIAIFHSRSSEVVGPIRSIRNYMLEIVKPYNSILLYEGCASSTDSRVNACGNVSIYGIESVDPVLYWRDSSRNPPHNLYTNLEDIRLYLKRESRESTPSGADWRFLTSVARSKKANNIYVDISGKNTLYNSVWRYSSSTKKYYREWRGSNYVDKNDSNRIEFSNIILIESRYRETNDSLSRIIIDTVGSGNGLVFSGGGYDEIEWKKESRDSIIQFYKRGSDEKIYLERGNSWIIILDKDKGSIRYD